MGTTCDSLDLTDSMSAGSAASVASGATHRLDSHLRVHTPSELSSVEHSGKFGTPVVPSAEHTPPGVARRGSAREVNHVASRGREAGRANSLVSMNI